MTKDELNQYLYLRQQLPIDIKRVLQRVARIQEADGKKHCPSRKSILEVKELGLLVHGDAAKFYDLLLDDYRIEGKWCYWRTDTNCLIDKDFNLYDKCEGRFLAKRLTMTDEELDAWADERIASISIGREKTRLRMEEARIKREKKEAKKLERKERAEYERLKAKYG
ncbi:MAG: hypothetical protein VZR36_09005 [Prevotella sp.]|nr:hypothetical protein [Prevotella sp.]